MKAYDLGKIYSDMEMELVLSMMRNLSRHEAEEIAEGMNWEQWQRAKLKDIRKFQRRNREILGQYQAVIDNSIGESINGNFRSSFEKSDHFFKRMLKRVRRVMEPNEKYHFSGYEEKMFALIKSVRGDLHTANSAALRMMDDVYRQTIFKTQMFFANGVVSLDRAIDIATKDFLSCGINCIQYKNGRRVNISSYAEMSLRTANQRAMLMADGATRDKYGIHLVCSSTHGNSCPLCIGWQGKILIDDVYSSGSKEEGDYPLLSKAMADGYLHPNCRHRPVTFFPGINQVPPSLTEEEIKQAVESYKLEQQQRHNENMVRKYRRLEEGSVSQGNREYYHGKSEEWKRSNREFIKKHKDFLHEKSERYKTISQ